jgi:hypothetical protein
VLTIASTRTCTNEQLSRAVRRINDDFDPNLNRVLVGEEVDDFESVSNDADGQEFLSVVATLHHQAERRTPFNLKPSESNHQIVPVH